MDDKKKIILATEDVITKKLEDIYINVNLKQKFNTLKKEKFDNNFDLAEQFRKERNSSRDFRVYGIIDSIATDCDNLNIKVYSKSTMAFGLQFLSNQIASVVSQKIGHGDKNVFGKMRGKYLIELNNYHDSDVIYIEILGDGINFDKTIIEQQLVFRGADGEFVEYGTNTVDVGINGDIVVINNDFPFFYNKHWIKTNFQIEQVKVRNVRFGKETYSINEGDNEIITVELNEPSVFGTESVTVELTNPVIPTYNTAAPNHDFKIDNYPFSLPINFNWGIGERVREIKISALSDYIIEKNIESFSLKLTNLTNVTTNKGLVNIDSTNVSIVDKTIKSFATYNFQKVVRNIFPLINPGDFIENLSVVPGHYMNTYGAKDGSGSDDVVNSNYRFFPNDTFKLTIKNEGTDTTLPVIPGYTTSDKYFKSGEVLTLNITTKYQNHDSLPKEEAVFDFKLKSMDVLSPDFYFKEFYINGIKFENANISADDFVTRINNKYNEIGIDVPFDVIQDSKKVTLKAKHPADNINALIPKRDVQNEVDRFGLQGDVEEPFYPSGRTNSITSQIPLTFKLNANNLNATSCRYSFKIEKVGYKTIDIPPSDIPSTPAGNNVFLVSPIKDVKGPSNLTCDYNSYVVDSNGYYINGVALISKSSNFSDTSTASNSHISGFEPSFRPAPLTSNINGCGHIEVSKVLS